MDNLGDTVRRIGEGHEIVRWISGLYEYSTRVYCLTMIGEQPHDDPLHSSYT